MGVRAISARRWVRGRGAGAQAQRAVEWLAEHGADPDVNDPLPAAKSISTDAPLSAALDTGLGKPLFQFGLIADAQHADIDDAWDFMHTTQRFYRHALRAVQMAVQSWRSQRVSFAANLGDLVDGKAGDAGVAQATVDAVHSAFAPLLAEGTPLHHAIGNHELMNFARAELGAAGARLLRSERGGVGGGDGSRGGTATYYSFSPHDGWRFVVLDAFVLSTIGGDKAESDAAKHAGELLKANNPNDLERDDIDFTKGLHGVASRWVPWNGAHGDEQLAWLRTELTAAVAAKQRVVVLTHAAVCPGACLDSCLCWDYDRVLSLLHGAGAQASAAAVHARALLTPGTFRRAAHERAATAGRGVVAAVFSGHDHSGGYACDEHGVHHVTLCAPLETPPPAPCHACVEAHADGTLLLRGYGRQQSLRLPPAR